MADKKAKGREVQQIATPGGRGSIPGQVQSRESGMPSAVHAKVSGIHPHNSGGKASVKPSKSTETMEKKVNLFG